MNWIYWTVPQKHFKRYLITLVLVMFILPQYVFGVMYTMLGFLINLIWFDLIFYGWVKVRDEMERMDK
tara:strand:+ start:1832 stop:2035 length:204 start_codon:yes stop_codon:yes gene_type:complete